MKNSTLYFIIGAQLKWVQQAERLTSWFALILPHARRSLLAFLSSPYHAEKKHRAPDLFQLLEKAYLSEERADQSIDIDRLAQEYGLRGGRRRETLRGRIDALLDYLVAFAAQEQLRNSPVVRHQLSYQWIRAAGLRADEKHYRQLRKMYTAAADRLPLGLERAYHRWHAAHATYLTYHASPRLDYRAEAAATRARFVELRELAEAMYRTEQQVRERILALPAEQPSLITASPAPLHELHQKLADLGNANGNGTRLYRRFVRAFVRQAPHLAHDQKAFLYLNMRNHALHLQKQGHALPVKLLARWPLELSRRNIYAAYAPLSPLFVLDEYNIFMWGNSLSAADELLEHLLAHLPDADTRRWVDLEAKVAYYFFLGQEDQAYAYTRKLLDEPSPADWRIHLRRHSYRLRSAMVGCARKPHSSWADDLETSLEAFTRYYYRLKDKTPRPNHATLTYINHFIVICRKVNRYLQQKQFNPTFAPQLRQTINGMQPNLHAAEWLRKLTNRLP